MKYTLIISALLGLSNSVHIKSQNKDYFTGGDTFNVNVTDPAPSKKMCERGMVATVNYTGKLKDGSVFDSTVKKGAPFQFVLD